MKVQFTLIEMGKRVQSQVKEYYDSPKDNLKQVEKDTFEGMEPGPNNPTGAWVEAKVLEGEEAHGSK